MWAEEHFRAWVETKAAEQGKSVRAVLRAVGVAENTFKQPPSHGRRIDIVVAICHELGYGFLTALAEMTGQAVPTKHNAEIIAIAMRMADGLLRHENPEDRLAAKAELTALFADELARRRAAGQSINTADDALAIIADVLHRKRGGETPAEA